MGIVRTLAGALAGSSWELVRGASEKDLRDFARMVAPVVTQHGLIRLGPAGDVISLPTILRGSKPVSRPAFQKSPALSLTLPSAAFPVFSPIIRWKPHLLPMISFISRKNFSERAKTTCSRHLIPGLRAMRPVNPI